MANEQRIDRASRDIVESVEVVFAAYTDSAAWEEWLPPADMTGKMHHFDFREGGAFRLTLTYSDQGATGKTTATEDVSEGTFVKILPNKQVVQRIVFDSDDPAFAGDMLMTWLFEPINEGTRVTVTAENVPAGISPEDHQVGLNSTLENLKRFVETAG